MKKLSIVLFVSLFVSIFLVSVAAETTITYAQRNALTDLDPAYGAYLLYPSGYEAAYCIFEGLVTFDEDLNFVPALATDWEVQEDGITWIFHLREAVEFHDGTPFDANAALINFERGMDPKRTTTNRPLWDIWQSAKAISEYTFEAVTKEPSALVLNALAHGAGHMVSPKAIHDYADHPEHNPVGTGPYMLEDFKVGEELTLVANSNYWGGRPEVDRLVFMYVPDISTRINALLVGEVDVIDNVPPHEAFRLNSNPDIQIISKAGLRPYTLNFLLEREVFQDQLVRQALNYAVDKEGIASGLFLGYAKPADSPLAFSTSGHTTTGYYDYDVSEAQALLAKAGWSDTDQDGVLDKNGVKFEFTIITPEGQWLLDLQVIEAIVAQWQAIGVQANIMKVERSSFWGFLTVSPAEAEWDMAFFAFNPSNAAGHYHLDSCYSSNPDLESGPQAWNLSWFSNAEFDTLLGKAGQTANATARNALLASAQEILWEECPSVWLVVPEIIAATRIGVNVELWPVSFTILKDASITQ